MKLRSLALVLVAGSLALGACGGDDDDAGSTTKTTADAPAASSSVSASSEEFEGLPLPEGAEAEGDPIERSDFVVGTFVVDGVAPEEVLAFYVDQLDGRDGAEKVYTPRASGDIWRGMWNVDERQVLVSAEPSDGGASLLTLSLRDMPSGG
jgi:hypothetical protein